MPSLFYAGQPDYIEKLNTLATAASMTNGTVAASFLSLAVTGTATAASFVGPLTGNASTATTLATARNINGVSFNGSADITVTAAAGTLTGATLAAGVTASSLTSVGTLTALTVSGQASFAAGSAAAPSVKVGAEQNGLYSSAANTLDVTLNGVRQFQFGYTASAVNYFSVTGSTAGGFSNILESVGSDSNIQNLYASKGTSGHVFRTNGSAGPTQFIVNHTASAVNYIKVTGAVTGSGPRLSVSGTDTNTSLGLSTKGSAFMGFYHGDFGNPILILQPTASGVNYAQITGSATGSYINFAAAGSDATVGISYTAKGAASHDFVVNSGTNFRVASSVASAVNFFTAYGQATGTGPLLLSAGSDANVNARYRTQGTGSHLFETGSGANYALVLAHVASVANRYTIQGAQTGFPPFLYADGNDTNVSAGYSLKGAGNHVFYTGTTTAVQAYITHTATAVNALTFTGSATGQPTRIGNFGTDANPDILIAPQGTGVLRFGTHSAITAETVTGYITIKDSAGNTRKLAVVS